MINPSELDLLEESVIKINRTAKVTSRGKRFRFSALVAVGDGKGHVGIGLGKANEVIMCIQKGKEIAKRNIVKIPLINGSIPHKIIGKHGASKVMLKPAAPGTGIIAGGPIRAACEVLGVKDIVAKSIGTSNPHNVIRACMKALLNQKSPKNISLLRNKSIAISVVSYFHIQPSLPSLESAITAP